MSSEIGERPQRPGIPVGRAAGVPVYLRPSWFAVAAAVTILFAPTVRTVAPEARASAYVVSFGFALLLLISVLVHELAHAAAAEVAGAPATHIVLDVWGGHTAFDSEARGPWRNVFVAAAGPLANVAVAVVVQGTYRAFPIDGTSGLLLEATAMANAIVAVLNALPGLPLDGGRVLEGLVWRVTGDRTMATTIAAWSGRAVAVTVVGWAVVPAIVPGGAALAGRSLVGAVWMLVVAGLLWHGAGQALAVARWQRRANVATTRALLRPAVTVTPSTSLAVARAKAEAAGARAIVVLDEDGRPNGVVDEGAAAMVPFARADAVEAGAVALMLAPQAVVDADLNGPALLERIDGQRHAHYAVLDGAGNGVVGVLDWETVARFVSG